MADKTEIAWADSTFNPWIGCTKVGDGCANCYAEADFDLRKHRAKWGPGQPRSRTSPANWKKPLQWNARPFYECSACGWRGSDSDAFVVSSGAFAVVTCPVCEREKRDHVLKFARRRVFCASLGDVFDNEVPIEWRRDLFALIELTPNLDWLLLTKRIGNVARMVSEARTHDWLAGRRNVWLGSTICNQAEADRDIPKLLAVPARVRFLSIEPMLGPVDLGRVWVNYHGTNWIDWVIAGGESGPKARPMHPAWVRSLRDQCQEAGVPFFFKQWGEYAPTAADAAQSGPIPDAPLRGDDVAFTAFGPPGRMVAWPVARVGTKAAGRLLDGVLHHEFPEVRT